MPAISLDTSVLSSAVSYSPSLLRKIEASLYNIFIARRRSTISAVANFRLYVLSSFSRINRCTISCFYTSSLVNRCHFSRSSKLSGPASTIFSSVTEVGPLSWTSGILGSINNSYGWQPTSKSICAYFPPTALTPFSLPSWIGILCLGCPISNSIFDKSSESLNLPSCVLVVNPIA